MGSQPIWRDTEGLSWWLFLACALVFAVASIRIGDVLFTIGSVLFLSACVVFLAGRDRPSDNGSPGGGSGGDG